MEGVAFFASILSPLSRSLRLRAECPFWTFHALKSG